MGRGNRGAGCSGTVMVGSDGDSHLFVLWLPQPTGYHFFHLKSHYPEDSSLGNRDGKASSPLGSIFRRPQPVNLSQASQGLNSPISIAGSQLPRES
jgi:hypothetical protein